MGVRVALVALVVLAGALPAHAEPTPRELPPVARHVPRHPASILDGCSPRDRALIDTRLAEAIDRGAPTYNAGDFQGCYRIYESTARQLETELAPTCTGPVRALRDGRAIASRAPDDSARAWAMRDAFDGLLIVLGAAGG